MPVPCNTSSICKIFRNDFFFAWRFRVASVRPCWDGIFASCFPVFVACCLLDFRLAGWHRSFPVYRNSCSFFDAQCPPGFCVDRESASDRFDSLSFYRIRGFSFWTVGAFCCLLLQGFSVFLCLSRNIHCIFFSRMAYAQDTAVFWRHMVCCSAVSVDSYPFRTKSLLVRGFNCRCIGLWYFLLHHFAIFGVFDRN